MVWGVAVSVTQELRCKRGGPAHGALRETKMRRRREKERSWRRVELAPSAWSCPVSEGVSCKIYS